MTWLTVAWLAVVSDNTDFVWMLVGILAVIALLLYIIRR